MPFPLPRKEYKSEEELEALGKIKKAREDGDKWFNDYYLKGLKGVAAGDKFRVSEMKENEVKRLDEGVKNFLPYACRKCDFEGQIPRRVFKMDTPPRNEKEWKELREHMKKKYKIDYFRVQRGIGINVIISGQCPQCESQELLFDYLLPSQQKKEKKKKQSLF